MALLAKQEMVLQDIIDRIIEIGRCCVIEIKVEKSKLMRIHTTYYDRSGTTREFGTSKLFG